MAIAKFRGDEALQSFLLGLIFINQGASEEIETICEKSISSFQSKECQVPVLKELGCWSKNLELIKRCALKMMAIRDRSAFRLYEYAGSLSTFYCFAWNNIQSLTNGTEPEYYWKI